ncbi:MAG: hypothetical protein EA419_10565 [Wenzhouxiangella sp.]|nr:MAG: hypothetical protein EA419_10565 [Wenzhouxiangella sp.]
MQTTRWAEFPHPSKTFEYADQALAEHWAELHRGDQEPFPDRERVLALDPDCADPEATALALQQAWRDFHAGRFAAAVDGAEEIGLIAHAVANKASGIYADYLEEDDQVKLDIYQAGVRRAEAAIQSFPDDANAHYFHAFLLGRYSQCISVTKALAEGVGGKIRKSLDRALKLAPKHAEALTASGLYHAEIIDKVGKLIGSMTYGASADKAVADCRKALELTPQAAIAHLEYGNALYLLYGDKRLEESNQAYEKAAAMESMDAMQKLDTEYAKASMSE